MAKHKRKKIPEDMRFSFMESRSLMLHEGLLELAPKNDFDVMIMCQESYVIKHGVMKGGYAMIVQLYDDEVLTRQEIIPMFQISEDGVTAIVIRILHYWKEDLQF